MCYFSFVQCKQQNGGYIMSNVLTSDSMEVTE